MDMRDILVDVMLTSTTKDTLDTNQLYMKMGEEVGELAEALLVEQGVLPHKTLTEDSFGEAADVLICLVGVMAEHHKDKPPTVVYHLLLDALAVKAAKYEDVVCRNHSSTTASKSH
jgi:NTP pyrophosphatase (non-canonical NTP hydrolase)